MVADHSDGQGEILQKFDVVTIDDFFQKVSVRFDEGFPVFVNYSKFLSFVVPDFLKRGSRLGYIRALLGFLDGLWAFFVAFLNPDALTFHHRVGICYLPICRDSNFIFS